MSAVRATSQPAESLLEGFATYTEALLGRAFPESQTEGLPTCDGCGRDDDVLIEALTGSLRCRDCLDAMALDGGDAA